MVTTEHSIGETHIERRKMTAGVRGLYLASELFSDATIAVSEVVKDRLIGWGVPATKITLIPNGLETERLAFDPALRERAREQFGIGPETYVIGALGRIDANKRVELTVEAAAPILGERCKILVIGRGDHQAQVEAAAARLGVTDYVIFGGFQPDTAAMMAAFDLYVATSVQETFGLAVLEAMASGLPVVYTVCPALDGIRTSQARQVAGQPRDCGRRSARQSMRVRSRASRTTRSSTVTAWSQSRDKLTTSTNGSWLATGAASGDGSSVRRRRILVPRAGRPRRMQSSPIMMEWAARLWTPRRSAAGGDAHHPARGRGWHTPHAARSEVARSRTVPGNGRRRPGERPTGSGGCGGPRGHPGAGATPGLSIRGAICRRCARYPRY